MVAVCAWLPGAAGAQEQVPAEPLVAFVAGGSTELAFSPGVAEQTVSVPVRLRPGTRTVTLSVDDAAVGSARPASLAGAFRARYVPAASARAAGRIEIVAKTAATARHGTYTLLLSAFAGATVPPENVTVQLVRAPAELAASGPVALIRTRAAWWSDGGEVTGQDRLVLRETGGRSGVSAPDVGSDPIAAGGSLVLASPAGDVPPGREARPPVRPDGRFPLGVTAGAVTVRAPELVGIAQIPYTLRERVHPGWIFVLVLAGVLTGLALRVVLARMIALGQARAAASDVLSTLDAMISGYSDPQLGAALQAARSALLVAAAGRDHDTLTEAAAAARREIDEARLQYDTARHRAVQALQAALATTARPWALPASVAAPLRRAADRLALAGEALDAGRPSSAETAIAETTTVLEQEIAQAALEWRRGVRPHVAALAAAGVPGPLRTPAATMLATLDQDVLVGAGPSPSVDVLTAVHVARAAWQDALASAGPALAGQAHAAVRRLRDESQVPIAVVESLARAADGLTAALGDPPGRDVEAATPAVSLAVDGLADAARRALVDPAASAGGTAEADVRADVDAGLYAHAADRVAQALPNAGGTTVRRGVMAGYALGGADGGGGGSPPLPGAAPPAVAGAVGTDGLPLAEPGAADRTRVLLERSARALVRAQAARTALLAALSCAVAYMLFGPGWNGTGDDAAKVFFWGLALDLSLEGITSAYSGVPAAGAGTDQGGAGPGGAALGGAASAAERNPVPPGA